MPAGGQAGDPVDSWVNPTSIVGGVLAVAAAAYLAAVYLVWDARRARRDATWPSTSAAAPSSPPSSWPWSRPSALVVLHADAAYLFDGLTSRALPLVILSGVCGVGALLLLVRDAARGARALAVVAVAGRRRRLGCRAVALPPAREPHRSPRPRHRPAP